MLNTGSPESNREQLKSDASSISEEARLYLQKLQAHKSNIQGKLSDVEVTYHPDNRAEISKAVKEIFGEETNSKTEEGKKAITLQMYLDCLEVVRRAGKFKAENVIAEKVF